MCRSSYFLNNYALAFPRHQLTVPAYRYINYMWVYRCRTELRGSQPLSCVDSRGREGECEAVSVSEAQREEAAILSHDDRAALLNDR